MDTRLRHDQRRESSELAPKLQGERVNNRSARINMSKHYTTSENPPLVRSLVISTPLQLQTLPDDLPAYLELGPPSPTPSRASSPVQHPPLEAAIRLGPHQPLMSPWSCTKRQKQFLTYPVSKSQTSAPTPILHHVCPSRTIILLPPRLGPDAALAFLPLGYPPLLPTAPFEI